MGANLVKDIYYAKYGDHATNRVNSVWYGVNGIRKDNIKYTYDKAGNVTTVTENGVVVARYVYDGLNRLIRENNSVFGKITYSYDNTGNVLCKTVNGKKYNYAYPVSGWKDQLLSFNGESFLYDVLGNPTEYRGRSLAWQGRRLTSYSNGEYFANYTYDVNNIRTAKHSVTSQGIIDSKYIYDGNTLVAEQRDNEWIYYLYGVDGIAGFNYNNETYLYRKNIQGDITHIYKQLSSGKLELVAQYVYDAWGNYKVLQDIDGIGSLNPFRYRGYYYDTETGLYYLQTRYYDAELGRFISADSIEYLDPTIVGGLNLYAYCGNNPVMGVDSNGTTDRDKQWRTWGTLAIATVVLVATAVSCIATVGATSPVLFGAFVGGIIGVASSAITQLVFTDTVDVWQMLLDGSVGAISGAVAVTGIGFWGSVAFGGIISGVASIGEDVIDGEGIDGFKFLLSVGLGMLGGVISGAGIDAKKFISKTKYFNAVLKSAVSPKKISMYTAKRVILNRNVTIGVIRFVSSILTGHFASKGLGKLLKS